MATTISTVNQALVDDKVVKALRYVLPMLNAFSLRVENKGMIQSDSVYVPLATDPSAQSKTAGTTPTANGTIAGTQVQLSSYYSASWDATEGKISAALFPAFWADKAAGAVYSLAKQVIDAALALVTATNYGNTSADKLVVPAADFAQSDLAQLWALVETKIKQRERSLGLNPAYAAALLGESSLALTFASSGTNFVQTGIVPQLLGMNSWAYGGFPANSENLGAAVFGRAAIAVATAPPDALAQSGEGEYAERRIITDPDSGLSVLFSTSIHGGGTIKGECEVLYGVAKGQDAVVRVVSA